MESGWAGWSCPGPWFPARAAARNSNDVPASSLVGCFSDNVVPVLLPERNARNFRADQLDIPREYPRPAAASPTGSGQTATSSLSCCKNLPAGRNVVPALLLQRQLRDDVAVKSQGLRQQPDDVVAAGPGIALGRQLRDDRAVRIGV